MARAREKKGGKSRFPATLLLFLTLNCPQTLFLFYKSCPPCNRGILTEAASPLRAPRVKHWLAGRRRRRRGRRRRRRRRRKRYPGHKILYPPKKSRSAYLSSELFRVSFLLLFALNTHTHTKKNSRINECCLSCVLSVSHRLREVMSDKNDAHLSAL